MSIASLGPSTLSREEIPMRQGRETNFISDIDGTSSTNRYGKYCNKPQFLASEIPGNTSKPLARSRNVPDVSLYVDDIPGARFFVRESFLRTNRHVDTLNPAYKLPSFVPTEVEPTKFIRDNLYHDDVVGSRTTIKRQFNARDTMNVNDIEGAQADWRPRHE